MKWITEDRIMEPLTPAYAGLRPTGMSCGDNILAGIRGEAGEMKAIGDADSVSTCTKPSFPVQTNKGCMRAQHLYSDMMVRYLLCI